MTLTELQRELLPLVESGMKAFLDTQDFGSSTELKEMLTYHMGWQDGSRGKRIRPLLTLMCVGALGGNPENAFPAAISIEFLHNFTLIHDDIQDQSPLRHGRSTLWQKWGIPQAINAGDALFSIAQLAMLELDAVHNRDIAIRAAILLNQTCLHLTRGQYHDMAFERADSISIETYREMIEGKTAALVAFCAAVSGIITNQSDTTIELLADFGKSLGMAFQIKDDILGIWGNPDATGKSVASDLISKKKTLPILYGLEHSSAFQQLWSVQDQPIENIETMVYILNDCGAQNFAASQAETYTARALKNLRTLSKIPESKPYFSDPLMELCESLLARNI